MKFKTKMVRLACLCISILLFVSSVGVPVNAEDDLETKIKYWLSHNGSDEWGTDHYTYKGPYDLSQQHECNVYYSNGKGRENIPAIYQYVLSWGVTKQAAAGMAANLYYECLGDYTCIEDLVPWSEWKWYDPHRDKSVNPSWRWGHRGKRGLGMIGFTADCMQTALFNTAAAMNMKWTDLPVQLEVCRVYFVENDPTCKAKMTDESLSAGYMGRYLCTEKIKPGPADQPDKRAALAEEIFNDPAYQNLQPIDYMTGNPQGGDQGGRPTVQLADLSKPVTEAELMGMPAESGLSSKIRTLNLKDLASITNYDTQHQITKIREEMELKHTFDAWDTTRVVFVFIGLLLLMYAILLALAMVFDSVNNWIDISLVTLFSLGVFHYSRDVDVLANKRHFIGTRRMIATIFIIFVIGAAFVSGAVLPFVMKWVYKLVQWLS